MEDKVDQVAIQMEMVDAMEDDIKRGTGTEDKKKEDTNDDGAEDAITEKLKQMMGMKESEKIKFKETLERLPVEEVSSRVVGSLTILQHVIMEGQGALVRLLLEHGVNPEAEGVKGWSPLEMAASLDNPGIFSTVADFTEDKISVKLNRLMMLINIEESGPSKDFEDLLLTVPVEEVSSRPVSSLKLGSNRRCTISRSTLLQLTTVRGNPRRIEHAKLLLKLGVDPMATTKFYTDPPLRIAIRKDNYEVAEILSESINLDLIPQTLDKLVAMCGREKNGPSNSFIELLSTLPKKAADGRLTAPGDTLLKFAVAWGRESHVKTLYQNGHGCDDEGNCRELLQLVLLAVLNGQLAVFKILAQLSNYDRILSSYGFGKMLNFVLDNKVKDDEQINCLLWLIQEETRKNIKVHLASVNEPNGHGETPIALACRNDWGTEVTAALLRIGANITTVDPKLAEDFLDSCIICDEKQGDTSHQLKLEFPWQNGKYSTWLKTLCDNPKITHDHILRHPVIAVFMLRKLSWHSVSVVQIIRFNLLFVFCLTWYILSRFGGTSMNSFSWASGESVEAPELSMINCTNETKPVYCQHLQGWLNVDTTWKLLEPGPALLVLLSMLVAHIFYIGRDLRNRWLGGLLDEMFPFLLVVLLLVTGTGGLCTGLLIMTTHLLLNEAIQLLEQKSEYFRCTENILTDIPLIGISYTILLLPENIFGCNCDTMRHLAALLLLLAWFKFAFLLAKHPQLSNYQLYLSMLSKVLLTSLPAIGFMMIFIVGFALSFYVLFHQDTVDGSLEHYKYFGMKLGSPNASYFNSPWTSVVKTINMFIGEIDFSEPPVDPSSPLSIVTFSFLITFVFFTVITLMNLLNGLAVSDIGLLTKEAEIVSIKSKFATICYLERRHSSFKALLDRLTSFCSLCPQRNMKHHDSFVYDEVISFSKKEKRKGRKIFYNKSLAKVIPDDVKNKARSIDMRRAEEAKKKSENKEFEMKMKREKEEDDKKRLKDIERLLKNKDHLGENTGSVEDVDKRLKEMDNEMKEVKELLKLLVNQKEKK